MEMIKQLKEENKRLSVTLSPYEMEIKDQYDMDNLAEMVDELQAQMKELREDNKQLTQENARLVEENEELTEELDQFKNFCASLK